MTRLPTFAIWVAFFVLAAPFILLGLYEIGCAIEKLRERRVERRDPQDRWLR